MKPDSSKRWPPNDPLSEGVLAHMPSDWHPSRESRAITSAADELPGWP